MASNGTQNPFKLFSAVHLAANASRICFFGTFNFVAMQVDRRRRDQSVTEIVAYRCQIGTACKSPSNFVAIRDRARRRIVDDYELHNVCLPQLKQLLLSRIAG
jgi:hypothetical protein